jgi:hypothetical protein
MQPRSFVPYTVAFFTTFALAIPASAEEGAGSFQPTTPAESRGTHDPAGDFAVTENDRALAARIRVSLEGDPKWVGISEDSLHIRVDNGMVTLQGQVATDTLIMQLGNQVKDLPLRQKHSRTGRQLK